MVIDCKYVYDLTPENYKALSFTGFTGKTMKKESDNLITNIFINDLGYTGVGDRYSKQKTTFFTKTLPKLVEKIQNKTFNEITDDCDDLQGGVKIIFDIYSRHEIILGLKFLVIPIL